VDMAGFEREMEKQRERAKAAQKFELAEKVGLQSNLNLQATTFVGYGSLKHESVIGDLWSDNKSVKTVKKEQKASLILESTPFYGEMGGQAGDTGKIYSAGGNFLVTNTIRVPPNDIIVHQGHVTEGSFAIGDKVTAEVDVKRRLDIARNHTATHLLQFALRQVLGEHVRQRGSLIMAERFSFDFSHLVGMTEQEEREVQHIVNERIRQNLSVYDEELPYKEAIDAGAIALFDEKYGDVVRVMKIGKPPISTELCGGTHVSSTGEIGLFHIMGEHSIGAGLRRIEAVTGRAAEALIERQLSGLKNMASKLATKEEYLLDKVDSLVAELDRERKRTLALERALAKKEAESLLNQAEVVDGVTLLVARVSPSRLEILREMADLLRDKLKSAVIVLGTVYENKPLFLATVTPDLIARGYNAGEIVKRVAEVTGGGGGGNARLGQAGGKDKGKLDKALQLVKSLICAA